MREMSIAMMNTIAQKLLTVHNLQLCDETKVPVGRHAVDVHRAAHRRRTAKRRHGHGRRAVVLHDEAGGRPGSILLVRYHVIDRDHGPTP